MPWSSSSWQWAASNWSNACNVPKKEIHRTSHTFPNIRKRNYYSPNTWREYHRHSPVSSSKSQFSSPRFGGAMSCIGSSLSPSAIAAVPPLSGSGASTFFRRLRFFAGAAAAPSSSPSSTATFFPLRLADGVGSFSPGTSKGMVPPADGSGTPSTSSLRKSSISVVSIACFLN